MDLNRDFHAVNELVLKFVRDIRTLESQCRD